MSKRTRKEIKAGVVGYGGAFNMGRRHLEEMRAAGMIPAAVAEIDPDRLREADKDFPGIGLYSDVAGMLKDSDVDLVTLITPHNTHAPIALQCIKAGRHVVSEKPLAITTADCDRMIAQARKSGVVLSTYHNRHWDGCIRQAVKKIRAGAIGEVVRIQGRMGAWGKPHDWWRSSKSVSGGILYDWGVHLLEYSLQLIDSEITEVAGFAKTGFWAPQTAWKDDTNEDEGFAVVRFASGQWLTLCVTALDANPKPGRMEVTGTRGTYVFEHTTWELITPQSKDVVIRKGKNPPDESRRYYENIVAHLQGNTPLAITPEWARRPIHILDLADRSARQNRSLKAKYG